MTSEVENMFIYSRNLWLALDSALSADQTKKRMSSTKPVQRHMSLHTCYRSYITALLTQQRTLHKWMSPSPFCIETKNDYLELEDCWIMGLVNITFAFMSIAHFMKSR